MTGTVDAYFKIPTGQTYHAVFPQAGLAPEMDGAVEPFVVIYSGEISFVSSVPLESMHTAVCMYAADGSHNIYPNLPMEGAQLPPGAHLGPP
ncbi:MAG: hypothetical protein ABI744_06385 [Chloroflexota bacterium]